MLAVATGQSVAGEDGEKIIAGAMTMMKAIAKAKKLNRGVMMA